MVELLGTLRYDKDLRVLVITGKGDSFSAGEDLKEFFYEQRDRMEFEALLDKSLEWRVRILRSFPVPTIAMVNGWCFGGAFSIVAGCDIAIAADEAMFGRGHSIGRIEHHRIVDSQFGSEPPDQSPGGIGTHGAGQRHRHRRRAAVRPGRSGRDGRPRRHAAARRGRHCRLRRRFRPGVLPRRAGVGGRVSW